LSVKLELRNKFINGSFEYWQRNTTFTSIANNQYHADRFHYIKTGTMVHNILRSTDVPSSAFGIYSMLINCTTAQSPILAGSYAGVLQHIEGNVLRSFKGKKMVLSFWVKATKTGTYCVALRNGTSTKAYVMEYSVSATNTWEKKTLRFTHDTTGTWAYDNTIGLTVVWTIAAGSTFQTTANTWANGNFLATANQVNGVDNAANNFQLTDVCLQEDNDGQTRTPDFQLAGRDVFEELQLCQRYFEKSYNIETAVGTVTNVGLVTSGASSGGTTLQMTKFHISKRINPVVTLYSSGTSVVTASVGQAGFGTNGGGSGASFHFTADAEL